ncbi:MAG TPA: hemin uptake protein HemP [Pirellulales bacterium]
MTSEEHLPPIAQDPPPLASAIDARVLHSEELFAGRRLVIIEHAGAMYRLQITARGRLILQK